MFHLRARRGRPRAKSRRARACGRYEGDVTNLIQDGVYYVCPENYGHDGSYESLKSYCAQWEKNQGTNHVPGIGQCPAGVPVV